jgi:hypothetical protein
MGTATILYGAGCAVTLWLARNDDRRLSLAFALAYVWMVANAAYHIDAMMTLVLVDVLVASLAACIGRGPAMDEIVILSAARVGLHIASAMGAPYEAFAWGYNATFAAMLASVASNGGIVGGLRDCGRAWRNRRGRGGGGAFRLASPVATLAGA